MGSRKIQDFIGVKVGQKIELSNLRVKFKQNLSVKVFL